MAEMTWRGDELLDRMRATLSGQVEAAAEVVAEAARVNCPIKTGALKASIEAGPAVLEGDVIRATVTATAPYAVFVEFGTIHEPLDPFLRQAVARALGQVRTILDGS